MVDADLQPGRATREGTRRFAARFPTLSGHFRCPDGLELSSIGLGTRPGEPNGADDLLYRAAVARGLERGLNVLDTAPSYRMQTSERSLGAALRRLLAEGRVARDEVYVISKGGYLTPDPDLVRGQHEARRYLVETYVETGLVDPDEVVGCVRSAALQFRAREMTDGVPTRVPLDVGVSADDDEEPTLRAIDVSTGGLAVVGGRGRDARGPDPALVRARGRRG